MHDCNYRRAPGGRHPQDDLVDLAAALDSAPVLIWISGPDKGGVYFNQTWLDFTGRTLEEEAGEGWVSGVHPDDIPALEACQAAFNAREPFQTEFRLRRKDGVWRWVFDEAVPRFTAQGHFAGFIGCCIDITERKETEAALRGSEERLQLAQEAALVGTYDWDIRNDRISWSPEMFRLHAIDPATPPHDVYARWLERLHPEDRDRADQETRDFVDRADRLSIEFRVVHPDGSVRWVQGRGRMIRDASGLPVRMIGANFDITERRIAEEALRESEQRLRDIAENFPGIIFRRITHPDGRFEYPYFSGADEAVFHLPRERLDSVRTMEDVAKLIHYEDLGEMLEKFERAATTLTPLELEGRVVREDGEVRWLRSISRPRPRGDGALIWDGVMLDVTEQHRQQGERERAATMLRMGMEVAGVGTWEFDPSTHCIVGSPAMNATFGLPADNQPRPIDAYMAAVHPEDVEWVREGLIEAAARKGNTSREYRVMGPDGQVRWIASRGSFVRLADGTERLIGALSDVTERRQREEERKAALERHQILLKELNHRVKNNLQMVTSVLRLQSSRVRDPAAANEFARATERVQTIADLHAHFGLDGGFSEIDFATYLADLCEKLRKSVLEETSIELRCQTEPCPLDLDRAVPLGLIANELVTNSIKHAFPGNGSGFISIELQRGADERLILAIHDSGSGVPAAGGASSGGLGMRLIEGLCRQIGATIETVNRPGVGYVITVPHATTRTSG